MAKTWNIGRQERNELAFHGHQRAIAAQDRGFFAVLIIPVDGINKDHFPRRDTSVEKLREIDARRRGAPKEKTNVISANAAKARRTTD